MGKVRDYRRIARFYDILDFPFEYLRYRPLRPQIFAGLRGRILDAGVGTGRNMPFYPHDASMVGIDFSPHMLTRARRRQARLGVSVELVEADALRTPFPDDHFDAVVATFLFCVLDEPQQRPALAELARICRSEGEIRVLEYALSKDPIRRFVMRLWAPWARFAYGAAFDRNTARYVPEAGLDFIDRQYVFHDVLELLVLRPRKSPARAPGASRLQTQEGAHSPP